MKLNRDVLLALNDATLDEHMQAYTCTKSGKIVFSLVRKRYAYGQSPFDIPTKTLTTVHCVVQQLCFCWTTPRERITNQSQVTFKSSSCVRPSHLAQRTTCQIEFL